MMENEKNRIDDAVLESVAGGASEEEEMVTIEMTCPDCGKGSGIYATIPRSDLETKSMCDLWIEGNYTWWCHSCNFRVRRGTFPGFNSPKW